MMEPKINCIVFVLVALAALAVVKITTSSLKPTEQPVVKRKTFAVLSSQPAVGSFREPISKAETELNLPRPLKIMEQYKALHSVDALTKHPHNRKFAVIFYTCPVQAGNRLHHFTTGLLWSIVTNRTALWKFYDEKTCKRYGPKEKWPFCSQRSSMDECHHMLQRASWIPSYDEWSELLGLDDPYMISLLDKHELFKDQRKFMLEKNQFLNHVDTAYPQQVVIFPQRTTKVKVFGIETRRNYLLEEETSRRAAIEVYSLGIYFLHGMLLRYSFDFSSSLQSFERKWLEPSAPDEFTVALHSRHAFDEDDGCHVEFETRCIESMLALKDPDKSCRAMVMSDRPCTITRLTELLEKNHCDIHVAHHENNTDYLHEHGPFAGNGYFQDIAVVRAARSAFIGTTRSSSDLILELIEFDRGMEIWRQHGSVSEHDMIPKCLWDAKGIVEKFNESTSR